MGLLLTVLLLLQGVGGQQYVFPKAGWAATLPCANVVDRFPKCSSTTWIYNSHREAFVEEVTMGKIRPNNTHRAERLSLLPDCSLHITDVTTEDAGQYTCRQYEGGRQIGGDATVELSVLTISLSRTEANGVVTLHCLLHTDYNTCENAMHKRDLSWVGEGGVELQNTNSLQIRRVSSCHITLTMELRAPNPGHTQRTWTCQLTAGGRVQTSVSHTIRVPVVPTRIPVVTAPEPTTPATAPPPSLYMCVYVSVCVFPDVVLIAGVAVSVSLLSAALLVVVVIHKRRTNARKEHRSKQSKDTVTYSATEHFRSRVVDPDAVCTDVQKQNRKQNRTNAKMDSEDTVTYSAIKLHSSRTVGPDTVYATTQKDAMIQH
ncbi:uncharacterized protein LOC125298834 [Alosa alosa]|uniref:uncharacterized protein LOC125298834 n=1 Tax=Alosa alosa TaxID=278164 RepID=UPI0020154147|nr:uncharacterized protein LOC125298834 [Alosa alosa]